MQEIFFSCKRNANGPCMCFWLGASWASIDQKLQKTPEEHTQQTNFERRLHIKHNKPINFMRDACFNNQQKIEIICQVLIQIALIYFDLCLGHARTTTNKLVDSQPCWSFPSRISCLYVIFPPHFFISKSWLGLLHIHLRTNEVWLKRWFENNTRYWWIFMPYISKVIA